MPPIRVTHTTGSYDVHVAPGLAVGVAERVAALHPGARVAVITDLTIRMALGKAKQWPRLEATVIEVPPGEGAKSREEWARVTDRLLAAGFDRDAVLVAIGGGSIGDLAGFVAATYLRGIPFVQVPTTLLAMVDASVGGKVGVDTAAGKNLVGAFHPPALVLCDPQLLTTLPDPIYTEGFAEGVKHGVVADAEYFQWIVTNASRLVGRDPAVLAHFVRRSVEIKAGVVSRDEHEQGERAILNAGHTIGHAMEHISKYALRHGEAVAIGLVAECRIAEQLTLAERGLSDQVAAALTALGLPTTRDPRPARGDLLAAMSTDKKRRDGEIRMALPAAIGRMARDVDAWTVRVRPNDLPG